MLRPLPHRGDVVAAGAVALAALVALLQVRFDDAWGKGAHFVYAAAALAFVGTLALRAPREGDAPRAYQSALLAVTFAPLFGPGAGTGWEMFLYASGFGLCAFSAVDRAPGPGWIGVGVLLATTVAAAGGKATLIGWPLVLAVGAGGLLAIGLRPSRPL